MTTAGDSGEAMGDNVDKQTFYKIILLLTTVKMKTQSAVIGQILFQ